MTLLVAPYFKHANNATWSYRTYIHIQKRAPRGALFCIGGGGAHVLCHGASFLGMPLAKARSEVLG